MGGSVSIDPESWIFVDKSPNFMSFMSRHLFKNSILILERFLNVKVPSP